VWIGSQGQSLCQREKIVMSDSVGAKKIGDRTNSSAVHNHSIELHYLLNKHMLIERKALTGGGFLAPAFIHPRKKISLAFAQGDMIWKKLTKKCPMLPIKRVSTGPISDGIWGCRD
jgi:hypothetical protein